MRILIVEDEKRIADFIARGLKEEHYAVDIAYDGEQGLYLAEINTYDLMIFDIMLPKLRRGGDVPSAEAQKNQYSYPDADRPGRC